MSLPSARTLLLGRREHKILEHIPPDDWITARQISKRTPYNVRQISACIRSKLLNQYVERREPRRASGGGYEYRRLPIRS